MLIGVGGDMTPIDFGFTRLKVKVARVTCKNNWEKKHCFFIIMRIIYHRAVIFQMSICLNKDMTSIDFELIRSKVMVIRVTFVKTKWFPLII